MYLVEGEWVESVAEILLGVSASFAPYVHWNSDMFFINPLIYV